MKRSLLVASCVLLVSGFLTSCQKEDKSIVELTQELTAELQKITDLPTANSLADRVKVLNKRQQDASVRVFALNATSLVRGADSDGHEGASYAAALKDLAREIGRVRASYPATSSAREIERDNLLAAVGAANGEADAAKQKAAGQRYMQDETNGHETPGNFPEYFGSSKLRDALAYRASLAEVSFFKNDSDEDVPAIPEAAPVAETPSAPADDDDESSSSSASTASDSDSSSDDSSSDSGSDDSDDDSDSSDSSDSDDDSSSSSSADELGIEF